MTQYRCFRWNFRWDTPCDMTYFSSLGALRSHEKRWISLRHYSSRFFYFLKFSNEKHRVDSKTVLYAWEGGLINMQID